MIQRKYDLEERTEIFGKETILLCRSLPHNTITRPLINQLVKAATSCGANYCEADNAESKKDFKHKIGICKKESKESVHFLKMVEVAVPGISPKVAPLLQEATELNLIFNSIYRKLS